MRAWTWCLLEVLADHGEREHRLMRVEAARSILHGEIKAKKFTYPLKLRNCGQPLIEHELEGIVVGADNKFSSP